MKFGSIKSKIDKILLESFSDKHKFKTELKNFQNCILENKKLSKLYWIYDELRNKTDMDSSIVNDYINETTIQYRNIVDKLNPKSLKKLNLWVENVTSDNNYSDIDNLFSESVLNIEEKIKSRKTVTESLKRKTIVEKDAINLPLSTMVNIANKTINKYVQQLDETDKNKLIKFLSNSTEEMESKYKIVKEDVLNKLTSIKKESELEVSNRIDETIQKIQNEKFDKLNLFRLEQLNNSI